MVYVARSGDGLLGALAFSDSLRYDALEVVKQLQALGLSPMVLSGDSPAAVAAMASQAGIPAHSARGAVSPAEKAQVGSSSVYLGARFASLSLCCCMSWCMTNVVSIGGGRAVQDLGAV